MAVRPETDSGGHNLTSNPKQAYNSDRISIFRGKPMLVLVGQPPNSLGPGPWPTWAIGKSGFAESRCISGGKLHIPEMYA